MITTAIVLLSLAVCCCVFLWLRGITRRMHRPCSECRYYEPSTLYPNTASEQRCGHPRFPTERVNKVTGKTEPLRKPACPSVREGSASDWAEGPNKGSYCVHFKAKPE
jgi:hypothetical protein